MHFEIRKTRSQYCDIGSTVDILIHVGLLPVFPLSQRWAKYGPRDDFMRPAGSYKKMNRSTEDAKTFFLLLIYIFGEHKTSSGKQVMRGYKDLFCSSRRRKK